MTNQKLIDEIVSDLLDLDPSFSEAQVRPLVAKFLAGRPEIEPTEEFRRNLYQSLLKEIQNQQENNQSINPMSMFTKLKFTFAAIAAVFVLLVVTQVLPEKDTVTLSGRQEINKLAANAFGSLNSVTLTGSRTQSGGGNGMGGDTNAVVAPVPAQTTEESKIALGVGGGGATSEMIWNPTYYEYVYKGEEFTVDSPTMSVYQRQKGFGVQELGSFLDRFNVGLFNIGKFANATMDYITASQNTDFGYSLYVDVKNGYVGINENWEKWQTPDRLCQDEACMNQYRLKPEQVPADEAVIAIADSFLDEYGISRANYGTPTIQDNNWRIMYAEATDKSTVWVPDSIQVIYPSKIGDNEIYEQYGNKYGMYVSVNIRQNKVSSVGELTTQRFDGSDYATEQDTARLLKIAQMGGQNNYIPFVKEDNSVTKVLTLGTPSVSFVRMWQYENNQSRELFVPSLVFPIQDPPAELYMRNVTVPLIKDILDAQNRDIVQPMPVPMLERSAQ